MGLLISLKPENDVSMSSKSVILWKMIIFFYNLFWLKRMKICFEDDSSAIECIELIFLLQTGTGELFQALGYN